MRIGPSFHLTILLSILPSICLSFHLPFLFLTIPFCLSLHLSFHWHVRQIETLRNRTLNHMLLSTSKDPKNAKKVKCNQLTDRATNQPTDHQDDLQNQMHATKNSVSKSFSVSDEPMKGQMERHTETNGQKEEWTNGRIDRWQDRLTGGWYGKS